MWGLVLFYVVLLALVLWFVWWTAIGPFWNELTIDRLVHESQSWPQAAWLANKRVTVVVNPRSGAAGRAGVMVRRVLVPMLRKQRVNTIAVVEMTANGEGMSAAELELANCDLLVVAGGDGTLHQLLNRIGLTEIPLAILPCGSSNGLASSLGILKMKDALRNLVVGSPKRCDVVEVSFVDSNDVKQTRHELQICAMGIIAEHDELQERTLRSWHLSPLLRGIVAPIVVMLKANTFKWKVSWTVPAKIDDELARSVSPLPLPTSSFQSLEVLGNALMLGGSTYGDSTGRVLPHEKLDDGAWSMVVFLRDGSLGLMRTFLSIHNHGQHLSREK